MILSILICSLESRADKLSDLLIFLRAQSIPGIEILISTDNGEITTGKKRNELLERATAEYLCFVDDDDWVSEMFISDITEALKSKPDCCSLNGIITWDGENPEVFSHSIKYKEYRTNESAIFPQVKYERYPNHLNVIKSSIAKQFSFPEIYHGEDTSWATKIFKSGLLKNEVLIPDVLYYYRYQKK